MQRQFNPRIQEYGIRQYETTLHSFAQFVYRRYYKTPVDEFLEHIKAGECDPYDILTEYSGFLKNGRQNENKQALMLFEIL